MSGNTDIRVNIALGGAQMVTEEMARLQKAMASYVQTAQQIPKLSPGVDMFTGAALKGADAVSKFEKPMHNLVNLSGQATEGMGQLQKAMANYATTAERIPKLSAGVDLFTGASLKGAEALKKYDPPMRNIVSLSGQVASGGRTISASFSDIPTLANALGLHEVAGAISGLQQVFTIVRGIATSAAGIAGLGLGALALGGWAIYQKRRELDQKAEDTTTGSVEANFARLTKMARDRIEAGVIRNGPAKDIEDLVSVINKGVLRMRDPRTVDKMGAAQDVQRMLTNLSGKLREDNQAGFQMEDEAARNRAQARIEMTREQLNAERQLIEQKLQAVLGTEKSTEQQRIEAAELYTTARRDMIQRQTAVELEAIALREQQLRAERERKEGDKEAQKQIDNELAQLADERVLLEKRVAAELQTVETENQGRLTAIREAGERDRLQKRIAAAQRENAEIRRILQQMADTQAGIDQRAQVARTKIDNNFRISEIERRRMRIEQVDAEIAAADIMVRQYRRMADAARDLLDEKKKLGLKPEELAVFEQRSGMADNALRDAQRRADASRVDRSGLDTQADPESVTQQFEAQWAQLRSATEQTARDLASVAMAPFQGMHAGLRDTLDQMMLQGGTFGDFMQGMWRGIGTSMRRALADMVANYVMNHVIMKGVAIGWSAFKTALGWGEVATSNAQEAAKTPALAANATLASIGSFGVAAVIGIAAIAAILASVGAFADGGRIYGQGGPREDRVLARVSPGEYVISEHAARAVGYDNLDMVNQGKLPVMAGAGPTNLTAKGGDVSVGVLFGPEMVSQFMESNAGRKIIVNAVSGAKMDMGLPG